MPPGILITLNLHFIKCELFYTVRKKTVSDAWNGYHSVPLRKEDRAYTTFIISWGRYHNCTLPQGYKSADGYSRRFYAIVSDVPNKIKVIDDALLWEDSLEKKLSWVAASSKLARYLWKKRH